MKVSSVFVLLASTALAGKPQTTPCESNSVIPVSPPAGPSATGASSQPSFPITVASSAPGVPDVTTKTSTYTTTTCPGKFFARVSRGKANISFSWHNYYYIRRQHHHSTHHWHYHGCRDRCHYMHQGSLPPTHRDHHSRHHSLVRGVLDCYSYLHYNHMSWYV